MNNMVDHPNHYQTKSGIETIDVMKAFTEDLKGAEAVDTSQVLKYICRWKQKNGLEDLKKAQWYLNDLIEEVSKQKNQEQASEPSSEESVKESFNRWLECEMEVHNLDADHFGAILWEVMFGVKPRTMSKRGTYRIADIPFNTWDEAYKVLIKLRDSINHYGYVTVDEYYRLAGLEESDIADIDFSYGWLGLDSAVISPATYKGCYIKFPKPIKIHEKENK